jgi:hypothetical protein
MANLSLVPYPRFRCFTKGTNTPLAYGYVYTLQPGTVGLTNLKQTWADSTLLSLNTNPVPLDENGEADIWTVGYCKLVIYDQYDVLQDSIDNVSSMPYVSFINSQWANTGLTPTYVSATSFTVPGDALSVFPQGIRIQSVDSDGSNVITGTVYSTLFNGILTTIVVVWDGVGLDNPASGFTISTSILTPTYNALPVTPVLVYKTSQALTSAQLNSVIEINSGTATSITLPATAMPSGSYFRFKNINNGTVTVMGSIDGGSSATILSYGNLLIITDGTLNWYIF